MVLTKRQQFLLALIQKTDHPTPKKLLEEVQRNFESVSRITLIRDLNTLLQQGCIRRQGKGRNSYYQSSVSALFQEFDLEKYFKIEPDRRPIQEIRLSFRDSYPWNDLFSSKELAKIHEWTRDYHDHFKRYPDSFVKKEMERITIEFSWKSSQIEGNTYSLLDTERLLKDQTEARGHSQEESQMILNHKKAFDFIISNPSFFKTISKTKTEEIHALIVENLGVEKGLRKHPVGIVGTAYKPFDTIHQIRENLDDLCHLVNQMSEPFLKATLMIAGLSYLQPFGDGNKRTSRVLGNAILWAHEYCPLSYRSVDEVEYKKATVLFYEQHSLVAFKKLMIDQYQFAVENYFR